MAFKILSFDELELLTENQRKYYEEELVIYNERVKFVEQIERFENTVITPYEPKLTAIPDISKAPKSEFVKPEYVFVKMAPITKPEPGEVAIYFDGSVAAVAPKPTKIKNVPVRHMKKMEQCKPILPIILRADVPANSFIKAERQPPVLSANVDISIPDSTFKKPEQASPNFPIIVRTQNFTGLFFSPITIDCSAMIENKPEMLDVKLEVPVFSIPKYVTPILPRSTVELPTVELLEISARVSPVLPKAIVPMQTRVLLKEIDKINIKLPKAIGTPTVKIAFDKPDIQKAELPMSQKIAIPKKKHMKMEYTVSDMSKVDVPKVHRSIFTAPEPRKMIRLIISKPDVMPKPLGKFSVDRVPKMEHPSIDILSIRQLKKIHSKASGLPTIPNITIPDINVGEVQKIKLLLLKEKGIKKEDFA